ncbi:MAG: hypothetical protein ACT4O1_16215 [Gemmatimonadota bacterium]
MHSDDARDDFADALDAGLAALPRELQPERDLRDDIWNRITSAPDATLWSMRYRLAAAALLLIALSSLVTLALVERDADVAIERPNDIRLVGRDPLTLQRHYSEEVQELELVLRKSRGALSPETVKILETNLEIIDNAIREAHGALRADPNSALLVDVLRSAYERKLELLRQAAKTSPVT